MAARTLTESELTDLDAYWRAANYLSVGQIYLQANPLLREPLAIEHIKPRLLGHWGTTPGLNLLYVHMNRAIRERALDAIYITGPGHGGPGLVANAYLEGTYSQVYSSIRQDEAGLAALFRQFSYPGGIPSHVARETPGSIHEGGELGYKPVVFAFHGYPTLIHRLTYRRRNHHNIHVRGFKEEGTATTSFDMVTLNDLDRYHLVIDVIDRVPSLGSRAAALRQDMVDTRLAARRYTREHGADDPGITGWEWSQAPVA